MFDCVVVGGGIAGLQASIQLGRYQHKVLVIDKGRGRSTLCRSYHNLLGYPDGVSGEELRRVGRLQAESLGVRFQECEVIAAAKDGDTVEIACADGGIHRAQTLLIATGVLDRYPSIPGLEPCLGLTIYVCPDCDGYEVRDKMTVVLGSGDVGSSIAVGLRDFTDRLIYINHERKIVGSEKLDKLKELGIGYEEAEIAEVLLKGDAEQGQLAGVRLADGRIIEAERAFLGFGGNQVFSDPFVSLGVERMENRHIVTDPRTKMTSVTGVWAAGDVGVHAEQVSIAMGEGAQAAIWIHKELMKRKARARSAVTV
ncbi:NAD(P)/FAD-dependent oxidoreductase [Paenibacillus sp. GD4]|jgi:thioredoxin reductase (NADPH)|uniref:NAD(P)/FAD-dependent oxidoreductase n=1 Tax=Paenibacillus sp. GD4 TaxID=3068890 RepID=UPI002796545D|nr:NAD(P)/FAD-dependent oxidoreductase [Paenibacillus sp. GD4]MDQ1910134.1 NAD(P)/FAD-dependent oxidoreductase [Paenibacillus sp. GD4]